jgi:hypothetical protein
MNMERVRCRIDQPVKKASIDDFDPRYILNVSSDFELQMETDEFIWTFSTG